MDNLEPGDCGIKWRKSSSSSALSQRVHYCDAASLFLFDRSIPLLQRLLLSIGSKEGEGQSLNRAETLVNQRSICAISRQSLTENHQTFYHISSSGVWIGDWLPPKCPLSAATSSWRCCDAALPPSLLTEYMVIRRVYGRRRERPNKVDLPAQNMVPGCEEAGGQNSVPTT